MHAPSIPSSLKRVVLATAAAYAVAAMAVALPAHGAANTAAPAAPASSDTYVAQNEKGYKERASADKSLHTIIEKQVQAQRLLGMLHELTLRVRSNNLAVAGLQKLQPTNTLATIEKASATVKGAGDAPWVPGEQAAIPSLAMAQKSVTDIQAQIQKAQGERAELEKKRTDATTQAETLSRQSDTLTGRQGLDVFTQAAAQRKAAADITAQIEDADSKLMLLQQDLSLAQAQQKQTESALAHLTDLSKQTSAGWDSLQKQMQAYTSLSKSVLEADASALDPTLGNYPAPPTTIAAAIEELNKAVKDIETEQGKADGHLSAAVSAFGQAATAARTSGSQINQEMNGRSQSANRPAWTLGLELYNVAAPTLAKAQAELRQAQMYASAASGAGDRSAVLKDLKAALDEARLSIASVTADAATAPEGDKNAAVTKARSLFDSAEKDLDAAIAAPSPVKDAARLTRALEQYSYASLLRSIQDNENADKKLGEARDALKQWNSTTFPLPPLPPELAPAPEAPAAGAGAPTTAPASGAGATDSAAPATQPATQPATK